MRVAQGSWLTFLDSDDTWDQEYLETVVDNLSNSPPEMVCHLGEVTYVGDGYRQRLLADIKDRAFPTSHAVIVNDPLSLVIDGMTLQGAAVRRTSFHRIGGFDEEMKTISDLAFFCRLAVEGPFLVTGRNCAEIVRIEGDSSAVSNLYRAPHRREMSLRALLAIPQERLCGRDVEMVQRAISGAAISACTITPWRG